MKWILLLFLILAMHTGASYLVPLDEKSQATFLGLLKWAWPWAYGDSGILGTIAPDPSGFPIVGFWIAVTSASLFLLAALGLFHIWIPISWLRGLTIAGAVLSIILMLLFFGPTKILPIILDILLFYIALKNVYASVN